MIDAAALDFGLHAALGGAIVMVACALGTMTFEVQRRWRVARRIEVMSIVSIALLLCLVGVLFAVLIEGAHMPQGP